MKKISGIAGLIVALLLATASANAALLPELYDPLDDTSHFISGALTKTANGDSTVSLTHVAAGDETAEWGIDGADLYIELTSASVFTLTSTASIDGGQWGFDILWFDITDTYISQTLYQAATPGVGTFSYNIGTGAPVGAVSWAVQFRVFDSVGGQDAGNYGFTFAQFDAFQSVPEPSTFVLGLIGFVVIRQVRRWSAAS